MFLEHNKLNFLQLSIKKQPKWSSQVSKATLIENLIYLLFSCKSNSRIAIVCLSVHLSICYQELKIARLDRLCLSTIVPIAPPAYWPSCLLTIMLIDHQAYRPSCLLTIVPIDHRAYRPPSLSTIEPIDHRAYWQLSLLTIKPIDHQAYRPSCLSTIALCLSTIMPIDHQAYRHLDFFRDF